MKRAVRLIRGKGGNRLECPAGGERYFCIPLRREEALRKAFREHTREENTVQVRSLIRSISFASAAGLCPEDRKALFSMAALDFEDQ